jgi:hypothetical protein
MVSIVAPFCPVARLFAAGVNTFRGTLTCKPVADSQQRDWQVIAELVE